MSSSSNKNLLLKPFPFLKKMRLNYLTKRDVKSNNQPVVHNKTLMELFPLIKTNPLLYIFLNRDFKPIGIRLLMIIISGVWFAVFPVYLFVIYMYEKSFFSYEFFTAGVFGLKSFFVVMLLLIIMFSVYLYGFIVLGKIVAVDYIKSGKLSLGLRALFWGAFSVACFFHLWLFFLTSTVNKISLFYTLITSSFILIAYFCTFIRSNKAEGVVNWVPSALFVFVSMSIPMFHTSNVAEAIEIGLKKFRVGPGQTVKVFDKSSSQIIAHGDLLLWSPEFVYFKDEKGNLHAYPTKNGTHIQVEKI